MPLSLATHDADLAAVIPSRIRRVIVVRGVVTLFRLFALATRCLRRAAVPSSGWGVTRGRHGEEYRALFAAHPYPMWVYDAESLRFLEMNDAAIAQWGYTRDELLRMRFTDLAPPGAQANLFVAVEQAHTHIGQPFTGQCCLKNGQTIDVEITSHPLTFCNQTARLVVARDITERMRSQRHEAAFIALGQQLSAATTEKDVARIIGAVADDLIGWDAFSLQHYVEVEDTLYAILNVDIVNGQRREVPPGSPIRAPHMMSRLTISEGGQLILRDPPYEPHPNLQRFGDTSRLSASLMFVPVRRGTAVVGILSIQSYTPHAYTATDLATLQALADHCGGALERTRAETALRASEARRRAVVDAAFDAILTISADGEIRSFNGGAERIFGYAAHEAAGQLIESLIAAEPETEPGPAARWFLAPDKGDRTHEMTGWRADGTAFPVELSVGTVEVDGETLYTAIIRDVSERKVFEARLVYQAYHDSLTGLPNRVYFAERLARALAESTTRGEPLSVLMLDLDRFKVVNDSLGHEAGDHLLMGVTRRLAECLRPTDMAARLGGDEFAVLLRGTDGRGAGRVAERILAAFAAPFTVGDQQLTVTVSIGIAPNVPEGDTPAGMMRDADVALYRAKAEGKARAAVFDARMDAHAQVQLAREQELRHALQRNDLIVRYQPLVNLQTGEIAGVEALVRWPHPTWGTVLPETFIALAEEADLIGLLDRWVLAEACRQARAWHTEHPERPPLIISVNLSARDFQEAHLVADIARVLRETGVNPRWVQLELTESVMLTEADTTLRTLHALKELGVRLALDDFGMGYASLRYLLHFPMDVLKVDRSFVAGIGDNTESTAIVRTIILLAQARGMEVIAEGVETAAQAAELRALGCTFGQGYYFAAPLLGADIAPIVAAGAIF